MNVKCKNCSGENPLGSIFCRSCGAKLSFEQLDADIKRNLKRKEFSKIFSKIFRVILIIFIAIAFYLAYLLIDPFQSAKGAINSISKDQEIQAISTMSTIDTGKEGSYFLTSGQINFLAQKYLGGKTKTVSAGILDGKYITFCFYETVFDYYVKLGISKTAVLEPEIIKNDKGFDVFSMKLKYIKFGQLSLPESASRFFADDFRPFALNSKVTRISKKIDNLKISADQVELILE